jgi:hypothetical protein
MTDEEVYRQAIDRILRLMKILAGVGTVAALAWRGWRSGAGFALGALIAWINFLWLKRIVDSLGASRPKASRRGAVVSGFRYLILGFTVYVILRLSSISLPAAVTGLFVSLGAVLIEILFELVYART